MKMPTESDLKSLAGVIFDLDGTLVDSRLDFAAIRRELGCPGETGVLEFIEQLPAARQAQAHAVVLRHERQGAENARCMPGARECLAHFQQRGLPTAILTRNAREIASLTLDRLRMPIDRLIAREDAPPKPAPDGLLQIAREWGLPPSRLVYVGDFRFDLEAAHRAGMVACYYDPAGTRRFVQQADWWIQHLTSLTGSPTGV